MKRKVQCIACTRDDGLRQQLLGWLGERCLLTHASDVDAVGMLVKRHTACVLLLDLRVPRSLEFLEWLSDLDSTCAVLCFAEERSRPALMAEERGVTELLPFVVDRKYLQAAVTRGAEIAELRTDNRLLQSRSLAPAGLPMPKGAPEEDAVFEINRASLCLDEPELLLSHAVQAVSTLLDCGRVTLYLASETGEEFLPSAGLGVRLDSMTAVSVSSELASWLKLHSQIMACSSLHRVEEREERLAISTMLSAFQADAIAPLSEGNQLIGWIAVGAPLLGGHLEIAQLSQLMRLCASLSAPIARSQEYRRTGFKRRLLEMVFENLATGVIALDSQEQVLWMNQSALTSLGATFKAAIGRRLGDLCVGLHEATKKLAAAEVGEGRVFRTVAGTPFLVQAQPIPPSPEVPHQQSLGLLLTLHDASAMEQLREQREAAFRRDTLAEMSVAMAFKIRAPLATIKTFTQLLPERRDDRDFLDRYRRHIANDVSRLEELSHSMHEFSLLQSLPASGNTKTQFAVSQLIDLVRCLTGEDWNSVQLSVSEDLPLIEGNCARLAEGVCHLLSNAREANRVDPFQRVQLRIARENVTKNLSAVAISVTDNRSVQKVGAFVDNSNLTSEEAQQRANLRLTFTAEIVQEFSGDLSLSTTEHGATVKVLLLA